MSVGRDRSFTENVSRMKIEKLYCIEPRTTGHTLNSLAGLSRQLTENIKVETNTNNTYTSYQSQASVSAQKSQRKYQPMIEIQLVSKENIEKNKPVTNITNGAQGRRPITGQLITL